MTTSTLTVTDFVLARIAEDEASVEEIVPSAREHPWAHEMCAKVHVPAERVLAQCAAMRKIVENASQHVCFDSTGSIDDEEGLSVLRALASIWSDHPDWREEWA